MARGRFRRRFRGSGRPVLKRRFEWLGSIGEGWVTMNQGLSAAFLTLMPSSIIEDRLGIEPRVERIVGMIHLWREFASTPGTEEWDQVILGMTTWDETARVAESGGANALPNPATETDHEWMWWHQVWMGGTTCDPGSDDDPNVSNGNFLRIPLDIRVRRRCPSETEVGLKVQCATAFNPSGLKANHIIRLDAAVRVLFSG